MNKSICIWFTIGGILILLGAVLFCLTACSAGFNFGNIFGSATEEITLVFTDDFEGLSIDTTTADLDFCLTDDGSCKVVATDEKGINYSANVEDGVLKISAKNDRKWYEKIFNIGFISSLTVYLPEAEYESLVINELTGNINVPAYLRFGSADIKLSTGKLNYYAETLGSISVVGSTGDVSIECRCTGAVDVNISTGNLLLNGIESAADINVEVSTGDVKIVNSVCNSLNIYGTTADFEVQSVTVAENVSMKNSTGKTSLTNFTCNNLTSEANTGDLSMTDVIARGSLTIERSTGDVRFDSCDAKDIYVTTDTGSVKGTLLTEKLFAPRSNTGKIETPKPSGTGACDITTDTGNIIISIKQ